MFCIMDYSLYFYIHNKTKDMKVIKSRITEQPKSLFDEMPRVFVTTEDGTEHFLYQYYPDEISFTENEFIGLTLQECGELYTKKDLSFLKS